MKKLIITVLIIGLVTPGCMSISYKSSLLTRKGDCSAVSSSMPVLFGGAADVIIGLSAASDHNHDTDSSDMFNHQIKGIGIGIGLVIIDYYILKAIWSSEQADRKAKEQDEIRQRIYK